MPWVMESRTSAARLRDETELALMADGKNPHLVARDDESVQGQVAGAPVRDDELPDVPFHAPADQRMGSERVDGALYRHDGVESHLRILVTQELKGALEMGQ